MSEITLEFIDLEIANLEQQREEHYILHLKADGAVQTLKQMRVYLLQDGGMPIDEFAQAVAGNGARVEVVENAS